MSDIVDAAVIDAAETALFNTPIVPGAVMRLSKQAEKELRSHSKGGVICIEGPDGTGKTTLAEHFVATYDALNIHATYRFKKMIPAYHEVIRRHAEIAAAEGQLVVLDRHWITECIYASTFRGGTKWPQYSHDMDTKFLNMGVLTILCLPNNVEETLAKKKERDLSDLENLEREKGNTGKVYQDDEIRELYGRYLDLWKGNMFYPGEDRASELTRTSGVHGREDFVRYRIEVEGADIDSFAWNAIKRLQRMQDKL
jgi:thymidylate kinase